MGSFGCRRGGGGGGTAPAFWVRYYGGSALRAAARWWRGAERAGGRRRGVGVFESSAGVRPCVSRWSVSARHDRACSMAVESPKCWQRGVVRLVERLPGQGARAGCAQDGHTRPRTRVAVALARSGPPASTASEASRGPFLVRGERGENFFYFREKSSLHLTRFIVTFFRATQSIETDSSGANERCRCVPVVRLL